jgi:hypothetical protein
LSGCTDDSVAYEILFIFNNLLCNSFSVYKNISDKKNENELEEFLSVYKLHEFFINENFMGTLVVCLNNVKSPKPIKVILELVYRLFEMSTSFCNKESKEMNYIVSDNADNSSNSIKLKCFYFLSVFYYYWFN